MIQERKQRIAHSLRRVVGVSAFSKVGVRCADVGAVIELFRIEACRFEVREELTVVR